MRNLLTSIERCAIIENGNSYRPSHRSTAQHCTVLYCTPIISFGVGAPDWLSAMAYIVFFHCSTVLHICQAFQIVVDPKSGGLWLFSITGDRLNALPGWRRCTQHLENWIRLIIRQISSWRGNIASTSVTCAKITCSALLNQPPCLFLFQDSRTGKGS